MTNPSTTQSSLVPATAKVDAIIELEIAVLIDLQRILQCEETALRDLDYSAIDAITDDKERIEGTLGELRSARHAAAGTIADTQRERYRGLANEIRVLGERNNRRLQICATTVRQLLSALTGAGTPGYGRSPNAAAPAPARAILTSSLG